MIFADRENAAISVSFESNKDIDLNGVFTAASKQFTDKYQPALTAYRNAYLIKGVIMFAIFKVALKG